MSELEFTPYQYSIIRYHHDAATHEFLNIGVSLFAPAFNYLKTNITTKYGRITDAFANANGDEFRSYVNKLIRRFEKLSDDLGEQQSKMFSSRPDDIEELLRKYLRRETAFRYSDPASGIAPASIEGLDQTFDRLYFEYVEKYMPRKEKDSRSEEEVWRQVYRPYIEDVEKRILDHLVAKEIETPVDTLHFDHAWKNERWHLLQPISFDLLRPGSIHEKAHRYFGRNVLLSKSEEVSHLYVLLGQPKDKEDDVMKSYYKAKDIIGADQYNYKLDLIEEDGALDFAKHLWSEIQHNR